MDVCSLEVVMKKGRNTVVAGNGSKVISFLFSKTQLFVCFTCWCCCHLQKRAICRIKAKHFWELCFPKWLLTSRNKIWFCSFRTASCTHLRYKSKCFCFVCPSGSWSPNHLLHFKHQVWKYLEEFKQCSNMEGRQGWKEYLFGVIIKEAAMKH